MSTFEVEKFSLSAIQKRNENTMCEWLGIEFVELTSEALIARMPIDHRTVQPLRIVNGGAYCVLAETVGSVAANMVIDREKYVAVGLDINANHVRSAHEGNGFVYGAATAVHLGKTTQVWEIRITDERGKLCCISRLTMAVIEINKDGRNFKPVGM
jgi:1,4-dihydroxy-2-naphthoyl-CoA hydrolase